MAELQLPSTLQENKEPRIPPSLGPALGCSWVKLQPAMLASHMDAGSSPGCSTSHPAHC